ILDILHPPEVSKPHTQFLDRGADVIVVPGHCHQGERKVMDDDEHLVPNGHDVRKIPTIMLSCWKVLSGAVHHVADILREVEADEPGREALHRVLRRKRRLSWVKLHSPKSHDRPPATPVFAEHRI